MKHNIPTVLLEVVLLSPPIAAVVCPCRRGVIANGDASAVSMSTMQTRLALPAAFIYTHCSHTHTHTHAHTHSTKSVSVNTAIDNPALILCGVYCEHLMCVSCCLDGNNQQTRLDNFQTPAFIHLRTNKHTLDQSTVPINRRV